MCCCFSLSLATSCAISCLYLSNSLSCSAIRLFHWSRSRCKAPWCCETSTLLSAVIVFSVSLVLWCSIRIFSWAPWIVAQENWLKNLNEKKEELNLVLPSITDFNMLINKIFPHWKASWYWEWHLQILQEPAFYLKIFITLAKNFKLLSQFLVLIPEFCYICI